MPASTLHVIAQILDVPIGRLLPDEKRVLDPLHPSIQKITAKLSDIEDVRFLLAVSSFMSAARDYTPTNLRSPFAEPVSPSAERVQAATAAPATIGTAAQRMTGAQIGAAMPGTGAITTSIP